MASKWPMLAVDNALEMVLSEATALLSTRAATFDLETNPTALLGKVLATDVLANEPVPGFAASIMDGYAVVAADGVGEYPITSAVTAGADPQAVTLTAGQVSYITTGAPVPAGADAVIPVEDTELSADKCTVRIKKGVAAGTWIRPLGSDLSAGQKVLGKNEMVSAAELGLLATVGAAKVEAYPQPNVGVLSTGDELVAPSAPVSGGKVRDSNRFMLLGAVAEAGGKPVDLGIVADKSQGIEAAVREALQSVDVLITSGGVSMGSLDLVKPLLERIGTVHFGRLNMKPGKPTTFASVNVDGMQKLVFALPGNPVSSYVTFKLLAHPCILRLRGLPVTQCHHPRVHARLSNTLQLDPARPEYHRAVLEWRALPSSSPPTPPPHAHAHAHITTKTTITAYPAEIVSACCVHRHLPSCIHYTP
jgi:gephyrin